MTKHIKLMVNGNRIDTDYFIEGFLDHTVNGMVMSLEGTPKNRKQIQTIDVNVSSEQVKILVNSLAVPANPFVSKLFRNTISGMISTLKGVVDPREIEIHIENES
jgi:hypothetical protein